MAENDIREVYRLLSELRNDMNQRFEKFENAWNARFDVHRVEHQREKDYRSGLIRWAVTTVLSGGGILLTLWLGITDKI